jgi:hypothetical protein
MTSPAAAANLPAQILCQQCAAPLPVEQGVQYVTCQFCGATNFVDKRRSVFHYVVRDTVRPDDAVAALRRWMGGNETVKDLDKKATIGRPEFQLFPMWLVRVRRDGQETVYLEPAAAISVSEIKQLTIPAADLEPYDHTLDDAAVAPTVPYEMMQQWLRDDEGIPAGAIHEAAIVHLPLFLIKYQFKGEAYTAIVDAASSQVFANIFPAKWEVPYLAIAAVAFVVYFISALLPGGGFLFNEAAGLGVGIMAALVIDLVLGVLIFGGAAVIAARV